MDTKVQDYIASQPQDRQQLLSNLHSLIVKNDQTVTACIEPMMGKEMIIYKGKQMMKYGLANGKNYLSLHVLPMYMHPTIYNKYKALLLNAIFQKGCINFTTAEQMPIAIVEQFITECALIDLEKMREEQLNRKKIAKKK